MITLSRDLQAQQRKEEEKYFISRIMGDNSFPVRETRVTKERRFLYPFLGYRSWTGLFFPILLEGVDLC